MGTPFCPAGLGCGYFLDTPILDALFLQVSVVGYCGYPILPPGLARGCFGYPILHLRFVLMFLDTPFRPVGLDCG